jgi:hypothetical protein
MWSDLDIYVVHSRCACLTRSVRASKLHSHDGDNYPAHILISSSGLIFGVSGEAEAYAAMA